jgi:hypothetical protein
MERMRIRTREAVSGGAQDLSAVVTGILEEVVQKGKADVLRASREYEIARSVKVQALQDISLLPFEVMLTDSGDKLFLTTGSEKHGEHNFDNDLNTRIRKTSRFTLHNHPRSPLASPSDGDLWVSRASETEADFIIGHEGITLHKFGKDPDQSISDRISLRGWLSGVRGGDHAIREDIRTGYADTWIPWSDPRMNDICDYINGTKTWEEISPAIKEARQ